jgi:hypothetical protein
MGAHALDQTSAIEETEWSARFIRSDGFRDEE